MDVNSRDKRGRTALAGAMDNKGRSEVYPSGEKSDYYAVVKLLQEHGGVTDDMMSVFRRFFIPLKDTMKT